MHPEGKPIHHRHKEQSYLCTDDRFPEVRPDLTMADGINVPGAHF